MYLPECHLQTYNQCCCKCVYQAIDKSHPWTDGNSVSNTRGYVCLSGHIIDGPAGVISGWQNEHGLCELFMPKEKYKIVVVAKEQE